MLACMWRPDAGAARRWARRVGRGLLLFAGVFVVYMVVLLHPDPLFAHEARYGNIVLHASEPLPPEAIQVARRAHERITRSPYFVASDRYDVYLCQSPELYGFLSLKPGSGGVAQVYFGGNVFLRPSAVEEDRLIARSGNPVPGDRTLTYYIAHELTHTMLARRIGRASYHSLAAWQQEGYADYVGKGGSFDFDAMRAAFRAGERELDPDRSGLYLRYHLLVAYALEHRALSPAALFEQRHDSAPFEAALRAEP
jgi:hypothetical protein